MSEEVSWQSRARLRKHAWQHQVPETLGAIFMIVGDHEFFPGVLAALSSILRFHPGAKVVVVDGNAVSRGFSANQTSCLLKLGVEIVPATEFAHAGGRLGAWELKAHAAVSRAGEANILVGCDADCFLCGPMTDVLVQADQGGGFCGGTDVPQRYDDSYAIYGFATPQNNHHYMSTSLYVCKTGDLEKEILQDWSRCCAASIFGHSGSYPGHGDQGVLNALLFKHRDQVPVRMLDNDLWSQHWVYWERPLEIRDGVLFNTTKGQPQRSLHGSGGEKPWQLAYKKKLAEHPQALPCYLWFLKMLFAGLERSGFAFEKVIDRRKSWLVSDYKENLALIRSLGADREALC